MAKKIKVPKRIKDPKKVAAGKARAAKSLRVDGKFTTNKFLEQVERDAEATGVKDPFVFYLQNQTVYENLYKTPMLTTNMDLQKMKKTVLNYDGKVFKNDKLIKKATAIKYINQLNQYLKTEHDVVACWGKLEISLIGKLNLNLPSVAEIERRIANGEEIEEIAESFGLTIIVSFPKSKPPEKLKAKSKK